MQEQIGSGDGLQIPCVFRNDLMFELVSIVSRCRGPLTHLMAFLQQPQPEAVIYSELVFTSRKYIRCVTSIELHWLLELAPRCFRQDTSGGGSARENRLTHMTAYTSRGFYTSREARDNERGSNIPQLTRKRQRRR